MTVMVVTALLGGAAGVASGGRVRSIAQARIRRWWLLVLAVLVQGTLSLVPVDLRAGLVVLACAALVIWCASNLAVARLVPGMIVLGVGVAANMVVIAVNGGMPVSARALRDAGYPRSFNVTRGHLDKHVPEVHAHLGFLGDFIPIPGIRNVLSLGDVAMLIGIFLVVRGATLLGPGRTRLPAQRLEVPGA
jgi:Family of unknown function (DUF5317)